MEQLDGKRGDGNKSTSWESHSYSRSYSIKTAIVQLFIITGTVSKQKPAKMQAFA
ncbi:hypothetical protein D3C76_172530 [compost metagenome]